MVLSYSKMSKCCVLLLLVVFEHSLGYTILQRTADNDETIPYNRFTSHLSELHTQANKDIASSPAEQLNKHDSRQLLNLFYLTQVIAAYRQPLVPPTKLDEFVGELLEPDFRQYLRFLLRDVDGFAEISTLGEGNSQSGKNVRRKEYFVNDQRQLIPVLRKVLNTIPLDEQGNYEFRTKLARLREDIRKLTLDAIRERQELIEGLSASSVDIEEQWTISDILSDIFGKQGEKAFQEMYDVVSEEDAGLDSGEVDEFWVVIDDSGEVVYQEKSIEEGVLQPDLPVEVDRSDDFVDSEELPRVDLPVYHAPFIPQPEHVPSTHNYGVVPEEPPSTVDESVEVVNYALPAEPVEAPVLQPAPITSWENELQQHAEVVSFPHSVDSVQHSMFLPAYSHGHLPSNAVEQPDENPSPAFEQSVEVIESSEPVQTSIGNVPELQPTSMIKPSFTSPSIATWENDFGPNAAVGNSAHPVEPVERPPFTLRPVSHNMPQLEHLTPAHNYYSHEQQLVHENTPPTPEQSLEVHSWQNKPEQHVEEGNIAHSVESVERPTFNLKPVSHNVPAHNYYDHEQQLVHENTPSTYEGSLEVIEHSWEHKPEQHMEEDNNAHSVKPAERPTLRPPFDFKPILQHNMPQPEHPTHAHNNYVHEEHLVHEDTTSSSEEMMEVINPSWNNEFEQHEEDDNFVMAPVKRPVFHPSSILRPLPPHIVPQSVHPAAVHNYYVHEHQLVHENEPLASEESSEVINQSWDSESAQHVETVNIVHAVEPVKQPAYRPPSHRPWPLHSVPKPEYPSLVHVYQLVHETTSPSSRPNAEMIDYGLPTKPIQPPRIEMPVLRPPFKAHPSLPPAYSAKPVFHPPSKPRPLSTHIILQPEQHIPVNKYPQVYEATSPKPEQGVDVVNYALPAESVKPQKIDVPVVRPPPPHLISQPERPPFQQNYYEQPAPPTAPPTDRPAETMPEANVEMPNFVSPSYIYHLASLWDQHQLTSTTEHDTVVSSTEVPVPQQPNITVVVETETPAEVNEVIIASPNTTVNVSIVTVPQNNSYVPASNAASSPESSVGINGIKNVQWSESNKYLSNNVTAINNIDNVMTPVAVPAENTENVKWEEKNKYWGSNVTEAPVIVVQNISIVTDQTPTVDVTEAVTLAPIESINVTEDNVPIPYKNTENPQISVTTINQNATTAVNATQISSPNHQIYWNQSTQSTALYPNGVTESVQQIWTPSSTSTNDVSIDNKYTDAETVVVTTVMTPSTTPASSEVYVTTEAQYEALNVSTAVVVETPNNATLVSSTAGISTNDTLKIVAIPEEDEKTDYIFVENQNGHVFPVEISAIENQQVLRPGSIIPKPNYNSIRPAQQALEPFDLSPRIESQLTPEKDDTDVLFWARPESEEYRNVDRLFENKEIVHSLEMAAMQNQKGSKVDPIESKNHGTAVLDNGIEIANKNSFTDFEDPVGENPVEDLILDPTFQINQPETMFEFQSSPHPAEPYQPFPEIGTLIDSSEQDESKAAEKTGDKESTKEPAIYELLNEHFSELEGFPEHYNQPNVVFESEKLPHPIDVSQPADLIEPDEVKSSLVPAPIASSPSAVVKPSIVDEDHAQAAGIEKPFTLDGHDVHLDGSVAVETSASELDKKTIELIDVESSPVPAATASIPSIEKISSHVTGEKPFNVDVVDAHIAGPVGVQESGSKFEEDSIPLWQQGQKFVVEEIQPYSASLDDLAAIVSETSPANVETSVNKNNYVQPLSSKVEESVDNEFHRYALLHIRNEMLRVIGSLEEETGYHLSKYISQQDVDDLVDRLSHTEILEMVHDNHINRTAVITALQKLLLSKILPQQDHLLHALELHKQGEIPQPDDGYFDTHYNVEPTKPTGSEISIQAKSEAREELMHELEKEFSKDTELLTSVSNHTTNESLKAESKEGETELSPKNDLTTETTKLQLNSTATESNSEPASPEADPKLDSDKARPALRTLDTDKTIQTFRDESNAEAQSMELDRTSTEESPVTNDPDAEVPTTEA